MSNLLFINIHQFEALGGPMDSSFQTTLNAEISLIRSIIPGVDHTTPPDEVITHARRFGSQHGLATANDIRNLAITALFQNHAQVRLRSCRLYEILSSRFALALPLRAHLLAIHTKNLERAYNWRSNAQ